MSLTPNYEKGRSYYWIHAATLACDFIGFRPKRLILDTHKPKGKGYHRVTIEVVRTKRECDAANRKWARKRLKFAALLAKHVAAKGGAA